MLCELGPDLIKPQKQWHDLVHGDDCYMTGAEYNLGSLRAMSYAVGTTHMNEDLKKITLC